MPRSRPGHVRAGLPRHRKPEASTVIDGFSSRALSDISRLERSRNYLRPGDVSAAMRLWKDYVHRPERRLWDDHEWGNADWYCCGDPFEARVLLDAVMQAMPPRNARELRRVVDRFDAVWNRPSPPYEVDDA
ncbi:hypothetical protein ACQEVS_20170 [Streptomyces sp. CA-181903]|uniref:hypothetical protein n=1 Tax=Streptomyces sp. CA-181903 TaxID=3240055 RepID=UPI003D949237